MVLCTFFPSHLFADLTIPSYGTKLYPLSVSAVTYVVYSAFDSNTAPLPCQRKSESILRKLGEEGYRVDSGI